MRRVLVLVLLVSVCPLALAQAYKWKDAQGVTHYADAPPAGSVKYETIRTTGGGQAPASGASTPTVAPAKPPATPPGPNTVADNPANRAKLCTDLHKNMDVLKSEDVVSMDDGKGGKQPLDAAGRQRQVEMTQAQVTLYCK